MVEQKDVHLLSRSRQEAEFVEDDDHAGYADGDDYDHQESDQYSDNEPKPTGKINAHFISVIFENILILVPEGDKKRKRSKKAKPLVEQNHQQIDKMFKKTQDRNDLIAKTVKKVCISCLRKLSIV